MERAPLLADQIRAIRSNINLEELKNATLWALWVS